MSIWFIGDVHGWASRLESLLDHIPSADDLVFCGDLIDRGPDSRGVIQRVRALVQSGRARCILGNHEYALVRGLGCVERMIPPDPDLFAAWFHGYGGAACSRSYGVAQADAVALQQAMADDLPWLADLPWYVRGRAAHDAGQEAQAAWLAVHAGLCADDLAEQISDLRREDRWTAWGQWLPPALYAKNRLASVPHNIPSNLTIISGHTPVSEPIITPQRILCDTSGGRMNRPLSAVAWPSGERVQSTCE